MRGRGAETHTGKQKAGLGRRNSHSLVSGEWARPLLEGFHLEMKVSRGCLGLSPRAVATAALKVSNVFRIRNLPRTKNPSPIPKSIATAHALWGLQPKQGLTQPCPHRETHRGQEAQLGCADFGGHWQAPLKKYPTYQEGSPSILVAEVVKTTSGPTAITSRITGHNTQLASTT